MNLEQELQLASDRYSERGYQVTIRPSPAELPAFAKDFAVEICARRGNGGVLVAVRQNRGVFAADPNLSRYAEVTGAQSNWRFDIIILESESAGPNSNGPEAHDFSGEEIEIAVTESERAADLGLARAGLVTAWAALEASMRMKLRAGSEPAGWGTTAKAMANELYSSGSISTEEFDRLERLSKFRNQIVHGFATAAIDSDAVKFIGELARRLRTDSAVETVVA